MKKSEVERLLDPDHVWAIGRGENRSVVMLLYQPRAIRYERQGVDLFLLSELWVSRRNRRKGHASELLRAATAWADESKTDLWLYVAPILDEDGYSVPEPLLIKLYRRFGFTVVKFRPQVEMLRRHA